MAFSLGGTEPNVSIHPSATIHPSAVIAEGANIGAGVTVGPFCTVGANVVLGEGCDLVSHVVLDGHATFGARNRIYAFACLGIPPQDLKYKAEPTRLVVGDDNEIREYVTISRGTVGGGGVTTVGSGCLIMAYTHIGHDSTIGNGVILANAATLAGHVTVEDYAVVGALNPVHQFCTIGRYAYVGGGTTVTQDVLPYSLTSVERNNHAYGLNKVGLQRRGFSTDELRELTTAMRLLVSGKRNTTQAAEAINDMVESGAGGEHVKYLLEFVRKSERGVIK
jgi:UDP-N-acetylglucosamine acyltransferase